jgi:RNA recognition motif-containing protein
MYDRGNYYDERYPPNPRKRYEIIKGNEVDRNNSTCLYVGNLPYSFREEEGN